MKIICAWHKPHPIVLGEKPGEGETHTICEDCKREFNAAGNGYVRIEPSAPSQPCPAPRSV